mgnify:CR=1 FL=1
MFLPYGYGTQRNNVLSPSTLSLERHRLLWLYLQNETDFFTAKEKKNVLHFAPEQEFYKRFKKQKNIQYTTTDLFSPLADVKADICNLPFKDNQYDVILCNHVLEHIPDDTKAMQELYRVLKPGGRVIMVEPGITPISKLIYKMGHEEPVIMGWDMNDPWLNAMSHAVLILIYDKIGNKAEKERHLIELEKGGGWNAVDTSWTDAIKKSLTDISL